MAVVALSREAALSCTSVLCTVLLHVQSNTVTGLRTAASAQVYEHGTSLKQAFQNMIVTTSLARHLADWREHGYNHVSRKA